MKVIYKNETKRIPDFASYLELATAVAQAFKFHEMLQFGDNIKLYYMDDDGDIVSITGQGDLEEAKQVVDGPLRLVAATSNEEAREALGESAVNRSAVLNQSLSMGQPAASGSGQLKDLGNLFE